jgi:N-acetylglucosamine kinase-like BadF-type ATPase
LIDESGRVLASHTEGPAYYLQIGLDELRTMLARGIGTTLRMGGISAADLGFGFLGLPAYGEDSQLLASLDSAASPVLLPAQYRCGNDAVCGWAGALACQDGINVVAGTGSIAYGEFEGRTARAGGWGELFSDEGSAYWVAREGLTLFSRMSDGRARRGALYHILKQHFALQADLDLCAAVYGGDTLRSELAGLAKLVAQAASAGDAEAAALFAAAAGELAQIVNAVQRGLGIPAGVPVTVSYSGGLFQQRELLLEPLQSNLAGYGRTYRFAEPRLSPVAGAALYAAKLGGAPLGAAGISALDSSTRDL